jgi:hypothetical protein
MPFLNQIINFIDAELKAGSLSKEKLQPATFNGLSSIVQRSIKGSKDVNKLEVLPATVGTGGKINFIAPDSKKAIQTYHRLVSKAYSYEKKSFGEDNFIKSTSEVAMVVITNGKVTGKTKDVLEPLFIFGMPQKLSKALVADLKINSCTITPIASNMDALQVFKQEYPQSDFFLTEQMSMFLIRYKIELVFSQHCIEQCLCN